MRIVNATRNRVLADRATEARSAWQRLRGLLGRDELAAGEALYISPCTSIHSFFMRFEFDAAFVDSDGRVLHLIQRMKRFRISKIVPAAAGVIELPAGVLAETGTRPDDRIVFEADEAPRRAR